VLVQGEATNVPMADACVDLVIMLGGIHHVPDRERLFREVHRILRPGGHFLFREPLSDLFLWRWVRGVIYRLSPSLDADTERPLSRHDTEPILEAAGLTLEEWRPCGLLGYCLLMNSDVLVVNRLLRFVPGIASFTRFMAHVDHHLLSIPDLQVAGLQVVGRARRRPSLTRAATIPENRRPNPGPRQEPHSA
jgi:SAM-dependent methyltransferase